MSYSNLMARTLFYVAVGVLLPLLIQMVISVVCKFNVDGHEIYFAMSGLSCAFMNGPDLSFLQIITLIEFVYFFDL